MSEVSELLSQVNKRLSESLEMHLLIEEQQEKMCKMLLLTIPNSKPTINVVHIDNIRFLSVKANDTEFMIAIDSNQLHYCVRTKTVAVHLVVCCSGYSSLCMHLPHIPLYESVDSSEHCPWLYDGPCYAKYDSNDSVGKGDVFMNLLKIVGEQIA